MLYYTFVAIDSRMATGRRAGGRAFDFFSEPPEDSSVIGGQILLLVLTVDIHRIDHPARASLDFASPGIGNPLFVQPAPTRKDIAALVSSTSASGRLIAR
jgi:hypothetical protein